MHLDYLELALQEIKKMEENNPEALEVFRFSYFTRCEKDIPKTTNSSLVTLFFQAIF